MGTPPVLLRLFKTWALLLLLLQGAWQPAFSHGVHAEGLQEGLRTTSYKGAEAHAAVEAPDKKETDFGASVAQWNLDAVGARGGVGGFHAQGHCEGRVREITRPALSCCAVLALEEARPVLSECGLSCCRRQPEAREAFEGALQRIEGVGVMSEVGLKEESAACCCVIKVDLPTLEPVVPPASAPSGGMVPELSWTTFRMEPGFTRRCWDPQLVGEARILASVRAQRGAYRVVHRVVGEAVEVLHCSFLL
jgi:hypothetical protein